MSGYTRQSSTEIIPSAVVKSAPVNAEFDELKNAFAFDATGNTGHKHDGSSDEGSYVPIIADIDGLNKVEIDTNNDKITFAVEVSSSSVDQFHVEDGVIIPETTNDVDLGSSSKKFKDLHLAGTGTIPTLVSTTSATFSGTVTISGTVAADIDMDGNALKNLPAPVDDDDPARKIDVDNIAGSATDAAASAAAAETALDEFTDLYLGSKASDPSVDNDGDALQVGALYWNTSLNVLKAWDGSTWNDAAFDTSNALVSTNNLSDLNDVPTARDNLGLVKVTEADVQYTQVSTTANASVFQQIAITASSTYTIALPASPSSGDWIEFVVVSGDAETNNVTVNGNGNNLNGDSTLVIDKNNVAVTIVFNGSEWRIA